MENLNEVEILIVEDNVDDAEMALRALKQNKLANKVKVVGIAWTGQNVETLQEVDQIKKDLAEMGITNYYSGHINSTLLVNTGLDLIGIAVLVE